MNSKIIFFSLVLVLNVSKSVFSEESVNPLTFHYNEYAKSAYSQKVAVIDWNSEEGMKLFEQAKLKKHFFQLGHHFKNQQKPSTCGIATAVTVMNAISEYRKQQAPLYVSWPLNFNGKTVGLEYRIWNEDNFFNDATDKVVDRRAIIMQYPYDKNGNFMGGIDMKELAQMFKIHGIKTEVYHADSASDKDIQNFRKTLKEVLSSDNKFIVGNYHRGYQGIEMGGHFSPLVAYDEISDNVLILDVAPHRNPWIWVSLPELYKSMNSKIYSGKYNRGYMIINK